ncbi:hypothetical protein CN330_24240 [Priestia megaterium]|uniref:hypothetical protein n=1 Tax=Priestia megaterium TaxID=1404 RepID=UPI000BF976BE|nr:hypothetical protein [Priestia megaterium]PEZ08328.1 hypothetical protein CN330_24240 [Priestia megaterium]
MGMLERTLLTLKERFRTNLAYMQRDWTKRAPTPEMAISIANWFDKPYVLYQWWGKLDDKQKEELLTETWLWCKTPIAWNYDWWISLFEEVGFISNCDIGKPTEPIKLYRGCRPELRNGMSWATDPEKAKLFVSRGTQTGTKTVFELKVQPEHVLAIIQEWGMTEYVVDYRKLDIADIKEYQGG